MKSAVAAAAANALLAASNPANPPGSRFLQIQIWVVVIQMSSRGDILKTEKNHV